MLQTAQLAAGDYAIETAEGTLHYTVSGQGPVCFALAGGPGAHPLMLEDLGGITDTVTLVKPHMRGSGESRFPTDCDWSLSGYARDVEALRQYLALDRLLILGHSHGGFVALRYAIEYPEHIGALILLDTSGRGTLEWDAEAAIQPWANEPWFADAARELAMEITADTTPQEAERNLKAVMPFYFARLTPEVMAYGVRAGSLPFNPAAFIHGAEVNGMLTDQRADLPRIQAQTLVIVGRHDFIQNVEMAMELTRLVPGAELNIFEHSGHFAWIEERERFHQVVCDFVRQVAPEITLQTTPQEQA